MATRNASASSAFVMRDFRARPRHWLGGLETGQEQK